METEGGVEGKLMVEVGEDVKLLALVAEDVIVMVSRIRRWETMAYKWSAIG